MVGPTIRGFRRTSTARLEGAELDEFANPVAHLAATAGDAGDEAAGKDVPAEVAMVAGGARQGVWVLPQNFVADGGESLPKDLADIRVLASLADDLGDRVGVNIADGQLIEVGGEAAARFDFAFRIDDQGLAGPFAVILLEPLAIPGAAEAFGALHGGQVIPVQRHRQFRAYQQIAMEQIGPVDHGAQCAGQRVDRFQALIGVAAGVGQ